LGLLVINRGYGTARNMRIATSQPQIVDNQRGLLVDFRLIGAQVNTSPVAPSLDVNLGNIEPQSTATARWLMTSTLQGHFVDFTTSFEHLDGLGNPRTSLIDRVYPNRDIAGDPLHFLEHTVRIMDGDDARPDFLADDIADAPNNLPDTVWSSDGSATPVTPRLDAVVPDAPVTVSHLTVHLRFSTPPRGFVFVRLPDPAGREFQLLRVLRSDGVEIRLDENGWGNVWRTPQSTRFIGTPPVQTTREARLYLFDKDSTGQYTLIYGQRTPLDTTIGAAKKLANGVRVAIVGGATAKFADGSYVEALDRSSGIKVIPNLPNENTQVQVSGILRTSETGERYVEATAVTSPGAHTTRPLGMDIRALHGGNFFFDEATGAGQRGMTGGAGLNMVGLLSSALGKVTSRSAERFVLEDGGGKVVSVVLPSGVTAPEIGAWVRVTGIVSMEKTGENTFPILRPRRAGDILSNPNQLNATAFASPLGLIQTGQNLLSLPGVPRNPDPAALFTPDDPTGSDLDGRLVRWDAPRQTEVTYRTANPSEFGGLLNGDGYRLRQIVPDSVFGFDGFRTDFADRLLALPQTGITQIGHPYLFAMNWNEVHVTNGLETISLADAVNARNPQWLTSRAIYLDALTQTEKVLGLPADSPDALALQPWLGYRVTSFADNLALIFPLEPHTTQPVIIDIDPRVVAAGDPDFFLDIVGEGFASSSVVYWNRMPQVTFYNSSNRIRARIPAALIAIPGTALIQVGNPALGGALSKAELLVIGSANLVLSGVRSIQRANGQISVTVRLSNTGAAPANNIVITSATINTTATQTNPLPQISSIPVGGFADITLTFPDTVGNPGTTVTLRVRAAFNGGSFTGSRRITLP
jgi:hypothetical protein